MAIDLDVHGNTKPLEAAVQAAINRIRRQPIKITVDDKGATQPLGNMKRAADEFSKSMEAANARILAFGASMAIINGVADAFKGMVRNMVEVEKSLADINVVMGLSAQNLDKFGDGLFKVAKETGAAFRVAADAATEYARQGLSVEESLKRTRDALILTRLTGMDSAEAVKALTAAMNTYGNQIKDTTQLVSKFAAVDVQFAVSAEDFAAAISRTGQAAKSAGVDIDELIGIVTSAQQQTARGGAVIGNALKTIFTKTGRTDTLNQLESLGIAVRDLEGNTIGAKRILTDLANTFDKLSEAQKAQITQTMGGLFHINILKAVLSDAAKQNGILARATEISSSATDEAIQKNQQLRETMSAMATETGLAIKQVSSQIGEIALAPGMEKILNAVKSLAEGLSGVLGDGESMGGKFANGLLKGIGNVITGPGLVVLTAVFFKLFGQAVKFTKESLGSLIGVTSEAQKQKAIQTSLVALIGQNAALGKEMLRTDISRTEKEKILLGLLRMQTAEAKELDRVTKGLASTLYVRGYGPGLTQGKRRAYGHIPNYADPERAQAARGGYAAGSIRTMNVPGEGPLIYNSAETVRNFAGFKQPAIMPPQSSKAGKNYQQAFGSIHGFDPYAAGGYIPNFNKQKGVMSRGSLNAGGENFVLLTGDQSGRDGNKIWYVGTKNGQVKAYDSINKAQKSTDRFSAIDVPYFGLGTGDKAKIKSANIKEIDEKIRAAAVHQAVEMGKDLIGDKYQKESRLAKQVEETFNNGSFSAAAGSTFESAIGAMMEADMFQDYSARTGTSLIDLPYSPEVFGLFGAQGKGKMGGEVKGSLNSELQKSAAEKFYKVLGLKQAAFQYKKSQIGIPSQSARGKFEQAGLIYDEKLQIPGQKRGTFAPGFRARANGYIPNFANPLSDAIGREKAAGVPVSQIRVGSHSALMSKGNPLGLGVTNTYDEPNGLRDVFGASGFVPNYAFTAGDIGGNFKRANAKLLDSINKKISSIDSSIVDETEYRQEVQKIIESFKINGKQIGLTNQGLKKADVISKRNTTEKQKNTNSLSKNTVSKQANTVASQTNTAATAANTAAQAAGAAAAMQKGGLGGLMRGMRGVGIMSALPMLTGFIPGSNEPGSFGSGLSTMISGASSGAVVGGMMPVPGGALIGGILGAITGMVTAVNAATDAINEKADAEKKAADELKQKQRQEFGSALVNSILSVSGIGAGSVVGSSFGEKFKGTSLANKGLTYGRAFDLLNTNALASEFEAYSNSMAKIISSPQVNKQAPAAPKLSQGEAKALQGFITGDIAPSNQLTLNKTAHTKGLVSSVSGVAMDRKAGGPATLQAIDILASPPLTAAGGAGAREERQKAQRALIASMFKGQESSEFADKKFAEVFGATKLTGEEILKKLPDLSQDQLDTVTKLFADSFSEATVANLQYAQGVIRQINLQNAILSAQDDFNDKMHTVNKSFASISNKYQFREKTMGQFMSRAEKNELNYNKSLVSINQKYSQAVTKNTGQAQIGLINQLKKPEFTQALKRLNIDEKEIGKMSLEEMEKLIEKAGKLSNTEQAVKDIIESSKEALRIKNDEAQKSLELSLQELINQKEIEDTLLRQRTGPKAFQYGFAEEQTKMRQSADELDHQLGTIVATNFRDGLVSGMRAAINQAEDLGDVMRGIATNFFQAIQNAYLTAAANRIVSSIPMPGIAKSRGGSIRNYSQGGGVPAMVSNGEYVMGRDAVAKYGGSFMHGLNAGGKIPGYSNGGATGSAIASGFGGGEGYVSGRKYQNKAMSGYFYSQSGNVGLEEDAAKMSEIIRERNERQEKEYQKAMEKYQKKMQLVQAAVGAAMSAGISWGANKFGGWIDSLSESGALGESAMLNSWGKSSGIDTAKVQSAMKQNPKLSRTQAMSKVQTFEESNLLNLWGRDSTVVSSYRGGPIRKYASGGYISGKSGIDQIPAMLSEGEYVIRASSARQLGKPMLDRINAGKFNQGGAVSEPIGSSETAASGGNTNNITISINMERGSGSKQETQKQDSAGQNPADRSNEEQNSSALAERIKQQVVAVIAEEQRPGGLLSD